MSGIIIGGKPLLARKIGNTDIIKVMVGDKQIWPAPPAAKERVQQ